MRKVTLRLLALALSFVFSCTGVGAAAVLSSSPARQPSCDNPYQEARVVNAVSPNYPDAAWKLNLGPTSVLVEVTIDINGDLVGSTIYKSSGNIDIDRAALAAARASTYAPKLVNCQATVSLALFHAQFDQATPAPTPALPSVAKPTFSPPAGWERTGLAYGPLFGLWKRDKAAIMLIGDDIQDEQFYRQIVEADKRGNGSKDSIVRTCSGTQTAHEVIAQKGDLYTASVDATNKRAFYRAIYVGPEPAGRAVLVGLRSLCVPT